MDNVEKQEQVAKKIGQIQQSQNPPLSNPLLMEGFIKDLKSMKQDPADVTFFQRSQLEFLQEIGRGAFAAVYVAHLSVEEGRPPLTVAIKCSLQLGQKELEDFKKEYKILSSVSHKNVVGFFGVCVEGSPSLIMEYCSNGSLNHLLKNFPSWKWPRFFHVALGAVCGLLALHNHIPQILHRDLKTMNLLVDANWNVKVADFGLSREATATSETLKALQGTAHYLAPEVLLGTKYSASADVYATGIILWEIAHRIVTGGYSAPYSEYLDGSGSSGTVVLLLKVSNGLRPTIPEKTPIKLAQVIQCCFCSIPEKRPPLQKIYEILESCRDEQERSPNLYKISRHLSTNNLRKEKDDSLTSFEKPYSKSVGQLVSKANKIEKIQKKRSFHILPALIQSGGDDPSPLSTPTTSSTSDHHPYHTSSHPLLNESSERSQTQGSSSRIRNHEPVGSQQQQTNSMPNQSVLMSSSSDTSSPPLSEKSSAPSSPNVSQENLTTSTKKSKKVAGDDKRPSPRLKRSEDKKLRKQAGNLVPSPSGSDGS